MDQNYDWINDLRQRYSDIDLINIDTFLNIDSRVNVKIEENLIIDYQMLNDNQKIVFKRIESYYLDMLAGHQVDPLKIIVMGTTETGKTYLIKAIWSKLQEMAGIRSKLLVVVLAPMGVAAFNINGITIHSKLSIPIINNAKHLDIQDEQLN